MCTNVLIWGKLHTLISILLARKHWTIAPVPATIGQKV
jgi:hypothetical protein